MKKAGDQGPRSGHRWSARRPRRAHAFPRRRDGRERL